MDVLPATDNKWQVRLADGTLLWRSFEDKGEAIARAKQAIKNSGNGCLVVRSATGDIQLRYYFES